MKKEETPSLFGIKRSNRDFADRETWGKNQFNSSFPAALACYLYSKKLPAVYIFAKGKSEVVRNAIGIDKVFGMPPDSDDAFFSFETSYTPYQRMVINKLPGVDLIVQNNGDGSCIKPIEIKLTALPDNSTCDLSEDHYGTEIVIRPDTIVYLACHIAEHYAAKAAELKKIVSSTELESVSDWSEPSNVIPHLEKIKSSLRKIIEDNIKNQSPFILQPIWKTKGKKPELADH